jgi:MFS family permease
MLEVIDYARRETRTGGRRFVIGILLMLMISIAYIDRINLSVAGPVIAAQFRLSSFAAGLLYGSFLWGYAATILLSGWLVDRRGKQIVLPLAVLAWTIVSVITGLVRSLPAFFGARILLGVAESPAYPAGNLIVRQWSPLRERGLFTSLMQTGTLLGPGLATWPAAYLVEHVGWRISFAILGSLGFAWLIAWLLIYRSPENARWLSQPERDHILLTRELPDSPERDSILMSLRSLLTHSSMVGIFLANGPQTYTLYFLLTWLPSYLKSGERGFDLLHSGLLTSVMYLTALAGAIFLAYASDRWLLLSPAQAQRGQRRWAIAAAMSAAMLAVLATPWVHNRYLLVGTIAVVLMMVTISITLTYALTNDLIVDGTSAGRTFAMVSFAGQVMGLLAPVVTGWVVGFASYKMVFVITAALLGVGAVSAATLPRRQFQPVR